MNKTSKAAKEEEHANLKLKNCAENQYKDSQQTYTQNITNINNTYLALLDLELDLDNIRKDGNIMDH